MTATSRAVLAASALAVLVALAGCTPAAPEPTDPPSSPEPSPSAVEPSPDPTPTGLSDAERQAVVDAVVAGDAATVAAAMADPVTYILASSECCGPLAPAAAAAELVGYTSSETGWTSADPAFIDQVRLSAYYADYVPADVISMRAASTLVVILGLDGTTVTSVLVGDETTLLF